MPAAKKSATAKSANKAYIFFNCDGEKSLASKNIAYNNVVYGNAQTSRKALWKKITEEMAASKVIIAEENVALAQKEILDGDPVEAAKYMQFGDIVEFERL
ncbi:MAG: hypothetical protein J6I62_02165 [Selenomonadaceae bacterium]|nr:hypothetical protein [Selenomonadaceae bacterium]